MPSEHNAPLFRIEIDGRSSIERDELRPRHQDHRLAAAARRVHRLGRLSAKSDGNPYQDLDDTAFQIGKSLVVKLGSVDETTTKQLFKGEIVTVEPDFQAGGVAMVVRAYDRSHRMMRSRKQRTFMNQTISDIVTSVGGQRHQHQRRRQRRATRLRAPAQRDRLGVRLAAREAHRLRAHHRRHPGLVQKPDADAEAVSSATPTTSTPSAPASRPSSRSRRSTSAA